jgi:hypothetical protein
MNFELKYGHRNTYLYELEKEKLNWLTDKTNRSNSQSYKI